MSDSALMWLWAESFGILFVQRKLNGFKLELKETLGVLRAEEKDVMNTLIRRTFGVWNKRMRNELLHG